MRPAPMGKREGRVGVKAAVFPSGGTRIQLARDGIIRLDRESRVSGIVIEEGSVWITETPANGDVIVSQGGYVRIRGGWPVLVQAMTEAKMVFSGA